MRAHDGFKRGACGAFVCGSCGRATRHTNSGNNTCCPECFELAGIENELLDHGEVSDHARDQALHLRAKLLAKGVAPGIIERGFDSRIFMS